MEDLTLERLEELRQRLSFRGHVPTSWADCLATARPSPAELLSLLDASICLRRLEKWLRWALQRECILGMGESSMCVELTDEDGYFSVQNAPTLLAAIRSAIDQAEKKET